MDDKVIKQIQREGADALLDIGISVPLKPFRLPFKKSPVVLRVTMKRPCLSGQILIARTYLSMGVTSEEMWNFDKEQEMKFIAEQGGKISLIIAYAVCRGWKRPFVKIMSWFIRNFMEHDYLIGVMKRYIELMGTDPFTPIIKSAEMTNPMKLRMSQKKKGS